MATSAVSNTTPITGTTVTSSNTSGLTSAQIATGNRTAAQNLITSLSAGSGVDVAALAQNLVNAEKIPQQNSINSKISKNESKISGYSALSYVMSQVQTAFAALKDKSSFNPLVATSSNANAITATASTDGAIGNHEIEVINLAKSQRNVSDGFTDPLEALNGGSPISLKLRFGTTSLSTPTIQINTIQGDWATSQTEISTVTFPDLASGDKVSVGGISFTAKTAISGNDLADLFANLQDGKTPPISNFGTFTGSLNGFSSGTSSNNTLAFTSTTANTNVADLSTSPISISIDLPQGKDTPQEIVRAINLSPTVNATGIKARLANTGDIANPYRVVISGGLGSSNVFTFEAVDQVNPVTSLLSFDQSLGQSAENSNVKVDGVNYSRTSNTLSDIITGVTLNLKGLTGTTPATVDLTRDDSALKNNINALVSAYNDAMTMFSVVSDPKSTVDTYGASLVGDSLVNSLKYQLRSMFTGDSSAANGTSSVKSLWQMGISIDLKGVMSLDTSKLDTVLQKNYNDVMLSFSGGYSKLSTYISMPNAGFANDAYLKINKLLSTTGPMSAQTDNANKQNIKYREDLARLQIRMDSMLARYTKQFATMDSMVGNINKQKTSLKSSFDGMMAMYTNK